MPSERSLAQLDDLPDELVEPALVGGDLHPLALVVGKVGASLDIAL